MKVLALLFVLAFSNAVTADGLKNKDETLKISESVMEKFIQADFDSGIDLIRPYWPLPMVELDGLLGQINTQWPIVEQRFGEAVGWEFVQEEYIGESFVRYYFLHKFQNHSIYWRISFYKPEASWVVNGITFLDSLDLLYQITQ